MRPNFDKLPTNEVAHEREIVVKEVPVVNQSVISLEDARKMTDEAVGNALEKYSKIQPVSVVSTKREESGSGEESSFGLSNKLVRELKDVVGVFTALKEISSNPLQTMIEQKVGTMAAGVVERSFGPPPQQSQDILDRILNSQTGAGLGAAIGQRMPEIIDKLTGTFGKEKTQNWMDTAMSGRGGGEGSGGGGGIGSGGGIPGAPGPGQGQVGGQQSEADLILKLDPNNSEHVVAYAQGQGGIPLDVARKMLMVHQDAFIKQMEKNGQIDRANEIMMKRNERLLNEREPFGVQENVQEYRRPTSSPYFDNNSKQNLDVEEQKVGNDLKKRQVEPDALTTIDSTHPQMKPEDITFENGSVTDNEQKQELQEQPQESGMYIQTNENNAILSQLTEMMMNQNAIILELRGELDLLKEKDVEKTRKKMNKADNDIFAGVRKTKSVKIGNVGGTV